MRIGRVPLDGNLSLAPMAGITDVAFRRLCRRLGAALVVSEMVTSDVRLWHSRKSRTRLPGTDEPAPVAIQIAGAEPRAMAEAARHCAARGAEIVDINLGCPAKKVCRRAAGSALMAEPARVQAILEAVVGAVDIPVTLKMRTGPRPDWRNAPELARMARDCGISALAVHGRTRACRFGPSVEYETITRVVQAVDIPVWANGDIDSPQKALEVLETTGASGIMFGRAARGNPWLFRDTACYLRDRRLPPPPTVAEMQALIDEHLRALYGLHGETAGVRIARKHIGWYVKPLEGGEHFRREFNRLEDAAAQRQAVEHYFRTLESADNPFLSERYGGTSAGSNHRNINGARAA